MSNRSDWHDDIYTRHIRGSSLSYEEFVGLRREVRAHREERTSIPDSVLETMRSGLRGTLVSEITEGNPSDAPSPPQETTRSNNMKRGCLFGIEVELEGNDEIMKGSPCFRHWQIERDRSLRGPSCELVSRPVTREEIPSVLADARKGLRQQALISTGRAGVHMHVNCSDMRREDTARCYYGLNVLAPYILSQLPEDRRENHYNVYSAREAARTILSIPHGMFGEKYSLINAESLSRHSTLELRGLPSTLSTPYLLGFANILGQVRALSLSGTKTEDFLSDVLDLASSETRAECLRNLAEIQLYLQEMNNV